jgi:hypothetical protein
VLFVPVCAVVGLPVIMAAELLPRSPRRKVNMLIVLAALMLARGDRWRGQAMPLCSLAYCLFRFATEFIRSEARGWGGLTFYQWSAVGIGAAMGECCCTVERVSCGA